MRKLPAIILSLTFLLALVGCGKAANNAEPKSSKSLYAKGLEIVQVMSEMTQNEEYVDIYTGSSEIKTIIQNIGIGDYSSPKAVYSISVTDENWAAMEELNGLDSASKELKTFLTQRVFGSLMTQINGRSGVENLAAASVCTVSNTFVDKNATDDVIYLYTYENAIPVAVTFVIGENQAVSPSGVFVMYDEFSCGSVEEIESFFSNITVDVKEILPEK